MESDGSGVALVTGAGGGVGGRTAEVLDRAGWRVALLGRTAASLERTARGLRNPHVVLAADVADRDAVEARVRETERRLGPPTALVNARLATSVPRASRRMRDVAIIGASAAPVQKQAPSIRELFHVASERFWFELLPAGTCAAQRAPEARA